MRQGFFCIIREDVSCKRCKPPEKFVLIFILYLYYANTYYNKYKLRTIRDIVSRWAPNNENNTAAYIRHVSDYTGIGPDKVLASPKECPTDWLLIGYAMAVVENGKALPAAPMLKGYALAMG